MYFAESGLLRKAAYGNGNTREYEYDRQGRVKKMIIDGVERFSYTYDSQGNLLSYTDLVANEKFTYVYDFLGRPVQVRTSSGFKIKLTYDEFNRASDVEFVNGTESNKTSWVFGNDSIVTGVKYNGVEKISYTYDLLKRQTAKTINTTNPFVTQYQYKNIDNYRTSTLIDKISYSDGTAMSYTYDANGNILTIKDQSNSILASYTYDSLNQLTGATVGSDVYVYTYDNGGNIVSKTKNGVEVAYTYGNTEWKDLLTNYNGVDIAYDTIGNPLNWINGETFTWGGGRQLTGITKGDNTISYTYNDSGIRTSKTVNGVRTDYYLNGTAIIMQKTGDNVIWYTYDENGNIAGMSYNGSDYWFYRNAQNDVIGIIDSSGAVIAKYTYDDWGKITAVTDGQGNDISSNATHIANINPIRYRGYYYDTETGLYYLQSRYYDAEVGRFVSSDGVIDNRGIITHNLFLYCCNNPIIRFDPSGKFWWIAVIAIVAIPLILTGCSSQSGNTVTTISPSNSTPPPTPTSTPSPEPTQSQLTQSEKHFISVIAGEAIGENAKTQKAVAHTIMNRVNEPRDVWRKAKSVDDVLIKSQYNAVGSNQYNLCMAYLNNRDGSNAKYEALISAVLPIYYGEEFDFTGGAHYIFNAAKSPKLLADLQSEPNRYVKCGPFDGIDDIEYRMYRCLW